MAGRKKRGTYHISPGSEIFVYTGYGEDGEWGKLRDYDPTITDAGLDIIGTALDIAGRSCIPYKGYIYVVVDPISGIEQEPGNTEHKNPKHRKGWIEPDYRKDWTDH